MVALFIANTDNAWFDFLADEPNLSEVNFWQPGGSSFHAIEPGEILAFRLKSPRNKIGGFGILSSSSVLPLQMAWETLGRSNGAPSYEALRHAIAQLRNDVVGPATNIGCRILVEPVFFPEHLWMALPASWVRNIVSGKRYSTDQLEGLQLWNELQDQTQQLSLGAIRGFAEPASRYGEPRLITPRLGQGAFRIAVTEAYGRRCAVSEGKVLPALDAAHIRPYADGGVQTSIAACTEVLYPSQTTKLIGLTFTFSDGTMSNGFWDSYAGDGAGRLVTPPYFRGGCLCGLHLSVTERVEA